MFISLSPNAAGTVVGISWRHIKRQILMLRDSSITIGLEVHCGISSEVEGSAECYKNIDNTSFSLKNW